MLLRCKWFLKYPGEYAIKVLKDSSDAYGEWEVLRKLRTVKGCFCFVDNVQLLNGQIALVEFQPNGTLQRLLDTNTISPKFKIVKTLSIALCRENISNNDIHPGNILINKQTNQCCVTGDSQDTDYLMHLSGLHQSIPT